MISSKISNKKYFGNIAIFLLAFVAFMFCFTKIAYAGASFIYPSFMDKYSIYDNGGTYYPNLDQYPFNSTGVTDIGFDKLYGVSKDLIRYKGEIPYAMKDKEGDAEPNKMRLMNGDTIDGAVRPWSKISEENDFLKLTPDSKDPHIYSMTVGGELISFSGGLYQISNILNSIFGHILNLTIWVKNMDLNSIFMAVDSSGELGKDLSKIFLINQDTGELSPFMVIMIVIFIFSIIALSFRAFRGDASLKTVLQEVGFLILAAFIAGICLLPNGSLRLSKVSMDFATALSNDITIAASDNAAIFKTASTNSATQAEDNNITQQSLLAKTYIDQVIASQFGCSINDLDLDSNNSKFGTKGEITQAMVETFGEGHGFDSMAIQTGSNGTKVNNLGYYWWAADTNVGISNNGTPFGQSGNGVSVESGSNQRMLYVIDFLANIKKNTDDNNVKEFVDSIMRNLNSPNFLSAAFTVLFIAGQNAVLCYSLFFVVVYQTIGKLLIILGSFFMVIMPGLVLAEKTRDFAKRCLSTYLGGFLRFIVGTLISNLILLLSTLISQIGIGGVVISAILAFGCAKFMPHLLAEINSQISSYLPNGELRIMNPANNYFASKMGEYYFTNLRNRHKGLPNISKDGLPTTEGEITGNKFNKFVGGLSNTIHNIANFDDNVEKFIDNNNDVDLSQNVNGNADEAVDLENKIEDLTDRITTPSNEIESEDINQNNREFINESEFSSNTGYGATVIDEDNINDIDDDHDNDDENNKKNLNSGLTDTIVMDDNNDINPNQRNIFGNELSNDATDTIAINNNNTSEQHRNPSNIKLQHPTNISNNDDNKTGIGDASTTSPLINTRNQTIASDIEQTVASDSRQISGISNTTNMNNNVSSNNPNNNNNNNNANQSQSDNNIKITNSDRMHYIAHEAKKSLKLQQQRATAAAIGRTPIIGAKAADKYVRRVTQENVDRSNLISQMHEEIKKGPSKTVEDVTSEAIESLVAKSGGDKKARRERLESAAKKITQDNINDLIAKGEGFTEQRIDSSKKTIHDIIQNNNINNNNNNNNNRG